MSDESKKSLAIVIPAWNNWHYTKKVIAMLSNLPDDHKIVIVDNGSEDETRNLQSSERVEVVRNSENLGFAKACNLGYTKAEELGYEHVMFLNNDIKVVSSLDSWTESIIEKSARGAMVGPTVGCLDANLNFVCESSKWPSRGYAYLSGWNLTASVETWKRLILKGEVGPFSSEFGLAYFEDTDLSFRAMEQNIPKEVLGVPVKHFGKATSKKLGLSKLYTHAKPIFLAKWSERIKGLYNGVAV